jgi:hypothetical protein
MWSSKHRPTQIGVFGCAVSRTGARFRTGEIGTCLLLTTCELASRIGFLIGNRRDSAWAARVCFVARFELEGSGSFGMEVLSSAALFGAQEKPGIS